MTQEEKCALLATMVMGGHVEKRTCYLGLPYEQERDCWVFPGQEHCAIRVEDYRPDDLDSPARQLAEVEAALTEEQRDRYYRKLCIALYIVDDWNWGQTCDWIECDTLDVHKIRTAPPPVCVDVLVEALWELTRKEEC